MVVRKAIASSHCCLRVTSTGRTTPAAFCFPPTCATLLDHGCLVVSVNGTVGSTGADSSALRAAFRAASSSRSDALFFLHGCQVVQCLHELKGTLQQQRRSCLSEWPHTSWRLPLSARPPRRVPHMLQRRQPRDSHQAHGHTYRQGRQRETTALSVYSILPP